LDSQLKTTTFTLPPEISDVFHTFKSPLDVQTYLDATPYSPEDRNRCPVTVVQDRLAHCLDGGLFGALGLRTLGYPPIIVDLQSEDGLDDDHVLAIFQVNGLWGSVAKSNFNGLRLREPVFRSLRELAMSYFEDYFNVDGVKSLRYYTTPLDLRRLDKFNWMSEDIGVDVIERLLKHRRKTRLVPEKAIPLLNPMDELSYQAGMIGVNHSGLYKPRN
jgi:hypothetical protein